MQKILSFTRRAVDLYEMINEGDKIAVGVSGGKDSVTLLAALSHLQRFYPKRFELIGITLDMGFPQTDFSALKTFAQNLNVPYEIKQTNIAKVLFEIRNEKSPCALCANLRRGALHNAAIEHGARIIALGHHNDDVLETFMMSLFFEGRIHNFSPKTYLDRKDLWLIRPFIFLPERDIIGVSRKLEFPVVKNPCPANGNTKRQYMKELIGELNYVNKGLKQRIFTAMCNAEIDGWKACRGKTLRSYTNSI